ncbi:MAG: hypothetical protein M1838_004306, partial [Thelocarpon superellum]
MVTVKSKEKLPTWDCFAARPADFSSFFRRVLSMNLDLSLPVSIRTHLLSFVISAFQSLDNGLLRKECAPLVSITIWHNLSSDDVRVEALEQHKQLPKAWRATSKRYDASDDVTKAKIRFDRAWLFSMTLDFLNCLHRKTESTSGTTPPNHGQDSDISSPGLTSLDNVLYGERFIEFLIDLESQLPTRRYVNALLRDLHLLAAISLSPLFNDSSNVLLRNLTNLLRHFLHFSMDDHTGAQRSGSESYMVHCQTLARLQRVALKHFPAKLTILALSNYAAIDSRAELETHLASLTTEEKRTLCALLHLRTSYPKSSTVVVDGTFLSEVLVTAHERVETFQEVVKGLSICPTEKTLLELNVLRNQDYDGSRPLAIPKLNLQYLTVGDFLWRSFILHRCEALYAIKQDVEDVLKRIRPVPSEPNQPLKLEGFSRMALPISKPSILDEAPALVGELKPAYVRAEIALDCSRLADNVRREWDALRPGDVVFLLAVGQTTDETGELGHNVPFNNAALMGLKRLRTAQVAQVLDENGRTLRITSESHPNGFDHPQRSRIRRLHINLDTAAYISDRANISKGHPDVYNEINLLVRRKGRENNFKPVLESIKISTLSDVPIPTWLQEVFLGYGDPASANYRKLATKLTSVDMRDTFLDWSHLQQSMSNKAIETADEVGKTLEPPYVLELSELSELSERPDADGERGPKKRRRALVETDATAQQVVKVSNYKPPRAGPYPTDAPKINQVRFTPAQIEAILSGTQPGLTCIVGPPGTGKTDVAVQVINNLYHDFPTERTLLVAHSNQALNQLFQKIIALDIDERHLLRLGHGEEDLATDSSYGKQGRVESFLSNRGRYLVEVDRLAINFGAPGAHGNSCETAAYFDAVYVKPAWVKYREVARSTDATSNDVVEAFPFHAFFANAPQPLFPADVSKKEADEIATGCYRFVQKIFAELANIRPFELLRNSRDKANYLLVKEARIIAMTATHAAIRRQEIEALGFHYDNVVMEEAAQITEIETFLPLALQRPKDGQLPLRRVVLCGDHLQNSPIIQNLGLRQYANLEQSLFLRLIRLGVPAVHLDRQGRARPTLADLYRWRYPGLGDLPIVTAATEFLTANAGFRYEYQFINVPDYKGVGEAEPTPHFLQNLGEAEYCVAIYQYMRLLGYPAARISILTTYAGQRALIRDVLQHRCARNPLFGLPKVVTTVDHYQGEQNDYVLVSLVRTKRVGYLRDIRRLTVALSRARLGLYVLGRRAVFEACYELKQAFDQLSSRPDQLQLVT